MLEACSPSCAARATPAAAKLNTCGTVVSSGGGKGPKNRSEPVTARSRTSADASSVTLTTAPSAVAALPLVCASGCCRKPSRPSVRCQGMGAAEVNGSAAYALAAVTRVIDALTSARFRRSAAEIRGAANGAADTRGTRR